MGGCAWRYERLIRSILPGWVSNELLDHFDAFAGGVGWDASISAQLAFLAKHLGRPGT